MSVAGRIPFAVLLLAGAISAQEFRVGSTVSDFSVSSLDGATVPFSTLKGSTTAVIFISTQCPVSNSYNSRMTQIYKDYSSKGAKFVFINANANEPASMVREHSTRVGFPFPVYKDLNNVVADRFGAQATPETFVIDSTGVIRYHGSIDDSQNEDSVKSRRLRAALDAVLGGKQPEVPETKAFGCSIKRVRKAT